MIALTIPERAASASISPPREPLVSVIIPTFNEAARLGATIAAIRSEKVPLEIIVVDANSTDGTARVVRNAGAHLVRSDLRQRGHQLNLGARNASGETILFLHADTTLPTQAIEKVVEAMSRPDVAGGAFARRYASPSFVLRATCLLSRCRNHLIGWHLGDQAMFVRRAVFFQLGGFREVDLFEDLDFSRRLKHVGHIVTLTPGVISSARRFAQGAMRTTLRDFGLTMRYLIKGLPPSQPGADVRPTFLS